MIWPIGKEVDLLGEAPGRWSAEAGLERVKQIIVGLSCPALRRLVFVQQ